MNKATIATITGLSAVALVVGGSIASVASGFNPFPQEQKVTEVAYAGAPVGDAATFDRAAAIQSAAADKAARDKAVADALAAQVAWEAQVAAEAAAAAQAATDAAARAAEDSADDGGSSDGTATWVPSDDPNNRNGGDWDTSGCASGRFETGADGSPVCVG